MTAEEASLSSSERLRRAATSRHAVLAAARVASLAFMVGCVLAPFGVAAAPLASRAGGMPQHGAERLHDQVHAASGMHFPAHVGSAVRRSKDSFQAHGEYAIARYDLPLRGGGKALVRIGVVHLQGMTPLEHYAVYKAKALAQLRGGAVRREGPFPVPGVIGQGDRGSFVGRTAAAGVITADFGYWSARLQSDYPLAQADEAQAAIQAFVAGLDWSPPRAL